MVDDLVIITSKNKISTREDKPLVLKWTVKEVIGPCVVNPRGLSKARKSVIIGQ